MTLYAAAAAYGKLANAGKLGARALGAAARRVLPAVVVYSFANAASRGFAGEGRQGLSGTLGALDEMARELVFADLVEDIAFPVINAGADAVEEVFAPGGFEASAMRNKSRRFGNLLP